MLLLDEECTRPPPGSLLQQRSTPETALAQQSAVMALLTASQQMAANRLTARSVTSSTSFQRLCSCVKVFTYMCDVTGYISPFFNGDSVEEHMLAMEKRGEHVKEYLLKLPV